MIYMVDAEGTSGIEVMNSPGVISPVRALLEPQGWRVVEKEEYDLLQSEWERTQ